MSTDAFSPPTLVEVSAAILVRQGKTLFCRRAPGGSCGGLWEFPGGKIEPGESPVQCAVRECREELGVEIEILRPLGTAQHTYPDKRVKLHFFEGRILKGEPVLRVHTAFCWAPPALLTAYPACPADEAFIKDLPRLLGG